MSYLSRIRRKSVKAGYIRLPGKKQGFIVKKKLHYLCNLLSYAGSKAQENIIETSLKYLTSVQQRSIMKASLMYLEKLPKDPETFSLIKKDCKTEPAEESIKILYRYPRLRKRISESILAFLIELHDKKHVPANDSTLKKLAVIKDMFSLNDVEQDLLMLFQLINTDLMMDIVCDSLNELMQIKLYNRGIGIQNKWPIAVLSGCKKSDIDKALSQSSTLMRSGLINGDLEVPSEVISFLDGSNDKPISQRYFSNFTGKTVPLNCHTIDIQHVGMVKKLYENKPVDQGVNILLYGEPGTGKTEFARSLGQSLGLSIYEVCNMDKESDHEKSLNFFRQRALLACQRIVDIQKSLIIVDEADTLLNSVPRYFEFAPRAEKGQINKVLDDSHAFIVWITNKFDCIDDSTKRRFDYSIGFEKLTFSQRRAIWQHSLVKYKLTKCILEQEIDSLASDYEISAGGIDVALRNVARMYSKSKSSQGIMDVIHGLMKAHLTILGTNKGDKDFKKPNAPDYCLSGLNIQGDVNGTMSIIDKFNTYWTKSAGTMQVRNMNLLLYGNPGTGKTEFAKYIARRTNRRLIVKRASDLLNMYVGETEKNMRRAFMEAERDKAILFIDEADSLLGSRENAVRSWEVTEVNEMLTNMETFRGMLICATNFKQIVDSAAIRRFNIKLEFDFLKPEGNLAFYEMFLKGLYSSPMSATEIELVKSLSNLTPGDFKVVYQKYSFYDVKDISHSLLIEALKEELTAKNSKYGKVMGFR